MIPLQQNTKTAQSLALRQRLKDTIEGVADDAPPDASAVKAENNIEPQTLEERVVRELMADASGLNADVDADNRMFTVPVKADELVLDGAKESTIDDYEEIPIAKFGLAMLRGMGLKDEDIKKSKSGDLELRPKGMGLGADKIAKPQKLLVAPAANEVLEIRKNAFVRILAGKQKDRYGQVSLAPFFGVVFLSIKYNISLAEFLPVRARPQYLNLNYWVLQALLGQEKEFLSTHMNIDGYLHHSHSQ